MANEIDNSGEFRNRISTIDEKGKRVWLFPKKPKGNFHRARGIVAALLLTILFVAPFIKINGRPLLLLDILNRKFFFFGIGFWPQDAPIFVFATLVLVVFVVLFTVVFGRVWCGWACPQTIFMEMVFRKIEYWIEGNAAAQRKLNAAPMSAGKFFKKFSKHVISYIVSFIISNMFLSYIIGIEELQKIISEPISAHPVGFIAIVIFGGVFYWIYAFFREQICTLVCPYGRLQGVLLDTKSIVVAYDYIRGEPRGAKAKGDCVDCNQCVDVCPTGIDIRNGTQLECVNCTACIDACNTIMDKVKKPRGLIRYDSYDSISKGERLGMSPRHIFYSVVLSVLLVVLVVLLVTRSPIETTILRTPGVLYQETEDNSISNLYNIKIINKTFEPKPIELHLRNPHGEINMVGGKMVVPEGKLAEAVFFVKLNKDLVKSVSTPLEIEIITNGEIFEIIETSFLGPNPYLKKKFRMDKNKIWPVGLTIFIVWLIFCF